MMRRFPKRTLVLMVLALAAFAHFYWRMTQRRPPATDPSDAPVLRLPPAP